MHQSTWVCRAWREFESYGEGLQYSCPGSRLEIPESLVLHTIGANCPMATKIGCVIEHTQQVGGLSFTGGS
jgi:hypothetical protein